MIEFQIIDGSTQTPWLKLGFVDGIADAVNDGFFKATGATEADPFNLTPFIKWSANVNAIGTIVDGGKVYLKSAIDPNLTNLQLVCGNLTFIHCASKNEWTEKSWEEYFIFNPQFKPTVKPSDAKTITFDLKSLSASTSNSPEFLQRTSKAIGPSYFSFGFIQSFQIADDGNKYFGRVDPIVKVSTNNPN